MLKMFFFLGLSLGWFSSIQFRQVFQGGLILAENYISVGRVSGGRRKPSIKAGQRYPSYAGYREEPFEIAHKFLHDMIQLLCNKCTFTGKF
jgi:hypothetical protein